MTRRAQAIAGCLVTLVVIVACGMSFADAANVVDPCGPETGWGPAKVDPSASGKAALDVPAMPVRVVDISEPPLGAAVDGPAAVPARLVRVQPRAPRAPPLG
jgi:multidrug efflux pump subunit AcrA (membrane-fusion protein)